MKRSIATAPRTVAQYMASIPEPARSTLRKIQASIHAAVPGATLCISYGMPMFKHKGMLAGFAAFSKHCSLFPGAAPIQALQDQLKNYRTSKGAIQFPLDKPLPATLVKKLVRVRIAEIESRQNAKEAKIKSKRR